MPALYPSTIAPEDYRIGDSVKRFINENAITPFAGKVVAIVPKTYKVWVSWPISGTEQHSPDELIIVPREYEGTSLVNHDGGYDSYEKQQSAKSFGVLTPAGRMRLARTIAHKFANEGYAKDKVFIQALKDKDTAVINDMLQDSAYTPSKDALDAAIEFNPSAFSDILSDKKVMADDDTLQEAVKTGKVGVVHAVLKDTSKFNGNGIAALSLAIQSKNTEIIKHLLTKHKDMYKGIPEKLLNDLIDAAQEVNDPATIDLLKKINPKASLPEHLKTASALADKFADRVASELYGKIASLRRDGKSQMEAYASAYDTFGDTFGDKLVREAVLRLYA